MVYNHTAEGNHLGPDAVASRHRQRRLLPPGAGQSALLHGLHRLRQHAQHAASARAAADHGLACATGCSRCTSTASASTWPRRWRASCTRSTGSGAFFDIIRQDPVLSQVKLIAEPWDLGEGGYQVGNFPVGWAEWNDRYRDTRARLLEGRRRADRRVRARASPARAISTSPAGAGPTPASISSPRTTASRCTTWSATTTSTTRPTARTTATATTTTCRGTAAPRDRPTIRQVNALRARQKRNFLATLAAVAGRADAAGRRRDRPHAARQQQRLLPGQRDLLDRLERSTPRGRELLELRASACSRIRREHPVFRRRNFFQGRADHGAAKSRTSSGSTPDGSEMTDEEWNHIVRALPRRVSWPATRSTRRTSAGAGSSTTTSWSCSTRTTRPLPSTCLRFGAATRG